VELVYTHALGACSARIESSSLSPPTKKILITKGGLNFLINIPKKVENLMIYTIISRYSDTFEERYNAVSIIICFLYCFYNDF
jgi:hypothetical protein